MGGHLTVTSQENCGSTFTFVLCCKVSPRRESSDDSNHLSDMVDREVLSDSLSDVGTTEHFIFQPHTVGSLFSSGGSMTRTKRLPIRSNGYNSLNNLNSLSEESCSFASTNYMPRDSALFEDACSVVDASETSSNPENFPRQEIAPDAEKSSGRGKLRHINANGLVMNRYCGFSMGSSDTQSDSNSQNCKKFQETSNSVEKKSDGENTSQGLPHDIDRALQNCSELSKPVSQQRILLVEDNKINIMVTRSMMKQLGHTIDVVNNGLEAVRAVQSSDYDLVLMDVCMPVMDGLQATRLIRSFEENGNWDSAVDAGIDLTVPCSDSLSNGPNVGTRRKKTPIVAMTANALAESAAECLANGMDSFVSKPVTFQKLNQCLQQYLR